MKNSAKFILGVLITVSSIHSGVGSMVRIKAIGSSPRGQFVAFEEFGYQSNDIKKPYAKIKIMNMWKNKIIHQSQVDSKSSNLQDVRDDVVKDSKKLFDEFNISV